MQRLQEKNRTTKPRTSSQSKQKERLHMRIPKPKKKKKTKGRKLFEEQQASGDLEKWT